MKKTESVAVIGLLNWEFRGSDSSYASGYVC